MGSVDAFAAGSDAVWNRYPASNGLIPVMNAFAAPKAAATIASLLKPNIVFVRGNLMAVSGWSG